MPFRNPLPLHQHWQNEQDYVQSLLTFASESDLFRNLCGGIHVLDFLTREPDLYTTVLPEDWRAWFDQVSVQDVLQLLFHSDLADRGKPDESSRIAGEKGLPRPPTSLVDYVRTVQLHCILREVSSASALVEPMPRHIAVGMKPKKIHEVSNFAAYVDRLSTDLVGATEKPVSIVDFGSGQNYLGRTLACPPYNKQVIAIEQRHHNIDGARGMDVHAKLAEKEKIMRNKKEHKKRCGMAEANPFTTADVDKAPVSSSLTTPPQPLYQQPRYPGRGSMTYIEHVIEDGHLEKVLSTADRTMTTNNSVSENSSSPNTRPDQQHNGTSPTEPSPSQPDLMVISLHSCGNLIHHGLRALILNPSVTAVAMIGCCYNLMTERLGPPTYKLPTLRSNHPRLKTTSNAFDPHGFPMSHRLETFRHKAGTGVRLNITARMMAVQAPHNWGPDDSEDFFRRHFYRALLQKILLDLGLVKQCANPDLDTDRSDPDGSQPDRSDTSGSVSTTTNHPLIVGSLRKHCFTSFEAYVHGALTKLSLDPVNSELIRQKTSGLTDDLIGKYESQFGFAKKNLSIIWSLMAFSAGVVESVIAVDRWLFLCEQDCVEQSWVEPVFEYGYSPRNLVVVGIKKKKKMRRGSEEIRDRGG